MGRIEHEILSKKMARRKDTSDTSSDPSYGSNIDNLCRKMGKLSASLLTVHDLEDKNIFYDAKEISLDDILVKVTDNSAVYPVQKMLMTVMRESLTFSLDNFNEYMFKLDKDGLGHHGQLCRSFREKIDVNIRRLWDCKKVFKSCAEVQRIQKENDVELGDADLDLYHE